MERVQPVILSGGSGTRLWPASRSVYPKQFVPLIGRNSLYQETLKRFAGNDYEAPIVTTSEDFRFMAVEQANACGLMDARIIVEPFVRNTAPSILAAATTLMSTPNRLMLVVPSDHLIGNLSEFHKAINLGCEAADSGGLVAFGVAPDRPETGYGYLEFTGSGAGTVDVIRFLEKPDMPTAEAMLEAKNFLWNAGILLGRVKDFIAAFEAYASDILEPVRAAVEGASKELGFERLDANAYERVKSISIDYAVMEKAQPVRAVSLDCDWTDLGAWDAIWSVSDKDQNGNVCIGPVTELDCATSYLRAAENGPRLVGLGLTDIVAVSMPDAVLVASRDRAQDVRSVVEIMRAENLAVADQNPRFFRPWGWYESLCIGDRFQVKRIMVKPGGILSLQSHMHRAEHWIVVKGTAEVTIGERVQLITENEGVYIPLGETHRMANRGKVPMYLIEVQSGTYLGEDDIVRYEDVYDRR